MEGDGRNSSGTQGIEGDHGSYGAERGFLALMNNFVQGSNVPMAIDDEAIRDNQMDVDHQNENFENDISLDNDDTESRQSSPQNSANANATLSDASSTNQMSTTGVNIERASDLLVVVSMYVEPTRTEIIDLAHSAMDELSKIASAGKPLWDPRKGDRYETLNYIEYLRDFGQVGATLGKIMKMVEVGEPQHLPSFDSYRIKHPTKATDPTKTQQIEASRDIAYVKMNPIALVELLMDLNQWWRAFYYIVARAAILGTLLNGVEASFDGLLQVMSAELHLPTPLVPTRQCYFARYCKQLCHEMWGVVDVSLEKFFPSPPNNFRRRPSGCLIIGMPEGYSKVIWVEHVEADHSQLNNHFKPLVTSGFAFGATRWLASLVRHSESSEALRSRTIVADDSVFITHAGRTSFMNLAERMMRSFCADISASTANPWLQLSPSPDFVVDEVRVIVKNHVLRNGTPRTTVVIATSLLLKVSQRRLFSFLRHESSRSMWDKLSWDRSIREFAYISKGKDPGNRVSLLQANTFSGKTEIFYIQESHTDLTGSYVVYAPLDQRALSALANGRDPDGVIILPCGFVILPPGLPGDDDAEDSSTGCLLTVAFHIVESRTKRSSLPLDSVETIRNIITDTVLSIKDVVNSWLEE